MKKRLISLALLLGLTLPGTACAAAGPAGDGSALCGYPRAEDMLPAEGDQAPLSRTGFLSELAAAAGADTDEYADDELPFTDCTQDQYIAWGWYNWLINGDGTGACRANSINREEAATILGRWLDNTYTDLPAGCGTGMPDLDNVSDWARDGVTKCWLYGVIDTGGAADFRPQDPVTVADARAWCANAMQVDACAYAQPEQAQNFADALVRALDADGNWSVSPYSVRLCLAMLANGAKGETRDELLAALRIDDLDAFNQSVRALLETYDGYVRIMRLETANSVWLNQSRFDGAGAFLPEFVQTVTDCFRAEAQEVTDADSVERVNAWADEKTNGRIPTILSEDNRRFVTALVNAVYFKAAWENEFDPADTDRADFTNADGAAVPVDMMHQTASFGYYATPGIQALEMPYRKYAVDNEVGDNWEYFRDADFSMYLIRTDEALDVQHFLDSVEFETSRVDVSVPKFQVEYSAALDEALKALGVRTAYDPASADLSAMVDPALLGGREHFLDTVVHKTWLAVDEQGTEAAAVTAAMTGDSAAAERAPLVRTFTADGPFWFVIRDNANGEILFAGRYETAN